MEHGIQTFVLLLESGKSFCLTLEQNQPWQVVGWLVGLCIFFFLNLSPWKAGGSWSTPLSVFPCARLDGRKLHCNIELSAEELEAGRVALSRGRRATDLSQAQCTQLHPGVAPYMQVC